MRSRAFRSSWICFARNLKQRQVLSMSLSWSILLISTWSRLYSSAFSSPYAAPWERQQPILYIINIIYEMQYNGSDQSLASNYHWQNLYEHYTVAHLKVLRCSLSANSRGTKNERQRSRPWIYPKQSMYIHVFMYGIFAYIRVIL